MTTHNEGFKAARALLRAEGEYMRNAAGELAQNGQEDVSLLCEQGATYLDAAIHLINIGETLLAQVEEIDLKGRVANDDAPADEEDADDGTLYRPKPSWQDPDKHKDALD